MNQIIGDIIIIGLQPWDIQIGSNCKNIALELSKFNRVFYINSPLDRRTLWKERNKPAIQKRIRINAGLEPNVEKIKDNLWTYYPTCLIESINWIKPHFVFQIFNRINNIRFSKSIKTLLHDFQIKNFTLFNDNSIYLGYHQKELLKPLRYIYYIRDNLTKNNYWGYHASRLEPKLIKNADIVVTNSTYYTEYAKQFNKNAYMIGQGCDFTSLNAPEFSPEELKNLNTPIIGYVGHLSHRRLDIGLMEKLAIGNPKWSFVLVGHEDDVFKQSNLHNISNVLFTGPKKPEQLATYISAFDICLNPQKINDATVGNYPRKIDEYLYLGRPTVASKTQAMDYFEDYVYLGNNAEEYESLIKKALAEDNEEMRKRRKSFAMKHTWHASVEQIYKAISNDSEK